MENAFVGCQKDREDSLHSSLQSNSPNLSFKHLQTRQNCINDPDHVVSLDEKFLRHCLELIHVSASKAASSKISVNLSSRMMGLLAEIKGEERFDTARFVFECPLVDEMMKEEPSPESHKFGPQSLHHRLASVSSSNSTFSDQSSASVSQGMLQCTWRDGSPHFVFSVDGHKEVYAANLSKVVSSDNKAQDYMYLLHSIKDTRKAHEIHNVESHLVGKMKVSTSFTVCPNNSRIMETEFILYGNNENHVRDMPTPSHSLRKFKGLSKKVVDVFKTSNSSKQRDYCSWDPKQDPSNSYDDELGEIDLLEKDLPSNFELGAIIVKDHLPDSKQREVGGWGLKFLKNARIKPSSGSTDEPVSSDWSTSMDIIVPAGLHGGPKTRNGGPSSLIERWKSGGSCDCSGWDLGCPLTVLNAQPSKEAPNEGECKAFDLIIKGSEHISPTLRMVNVQDGLYSVHFQSVLSDLQSFSIAVALVHARRPKYVQAMK